MRARSPLLVTLLLAGLVIRLVLEVGSRDRTGAGSPASAAPAGGAAPAVLAAPAGTLDDARGDARSPAPRTGPRTAPRTAPRTEVPPAPTAPEPPPPEARGLEDGQLPPPIAAPGTAAALGPAGAGAPTDAP